jgi:hypothetical protein
MLEKELIFGSQRRPIYVYSPGWTPSSAGKRLLHYLCHNLNLSGFPTWLYIHPSSDAVSDTNIALLTPVVTREVFSHHKRIGIEPIVIYPESIMGNPLNAQTVIRWYLNFRNALGVDNFSPSEFSIGYSENISISLPKSHGTIFIPAINPVELPKPAMKNGKTLIYLGKSQVFKSAEVLQFLKKIDTEKYDVLARDSFPMMNRIEFLKNLSKYSRVAAFENSSVLTEATLMGSVGIFLPNEHLSQAIAEHELGWDGYAWGEDPLEIERAESTLHVALTRYREACESFPASLTSVFTRISDEAPLPDKFCLKNNHIFFHNKMRSISIYKQFGARVFLKSVFSFLKRRIGRLKD